jgi:putative acetyltransferase
MAVLPDKQRQGVGEALVTQGLQTLRDGGWHGVVVLGHPQYYPRFGFVPASRFGLSFPTDVPDEAFMAVALQEGALDSCSGEVIYHKAFKLGGP